MSGLGGPWDLEGGAAGPARPGMVELGSDVQLLALLHALTQAELALLSPGSHVPVGREQGGVLGSERFSG